MTKLFSLVAIGIMLFLSNTAMAQVKSDIIGNWTSKNEDKKITVNIYLAVDGNYYGKAGDKFVFDKLTYNSAKNNFTGTMSPPDVSMTLNATVTFVNKDEIKVVVKKLLMTKTMYLKRVV